MRSLIISGALGGIIATSLIACGPAPTAREQQQRQHELGCMAGTLGGALIGGAIGNQFGGGRGQNIMRAGGAATGAVSGSRYAC